jgi:hypothetical protein
MERRADVTRWEGSWMKCFAGFVVSRVRIGAVDVC